MKVDSNIYDIDGNLIRKAGDTHKFTVEEVEKLVDDLTKKTFLLLEPVLLGKVQENPKITVYKTYLNNARAWLYNMYNSMSREDLTKRLSVLQNSINEAKAEENAEEKAKLDAISEAMEQLKAEYEADNQSDSPEILEDVRPDTVMDEYVNYEEVK